MAAQKQDVKLLSGGTMILLLFIAVGAVAAVLRLAQGLGEEVWYRAWFQRNSRRRKARIRSFSGCS